MPTYQTDTGYIHERYGGQEQGFGERLAAASAREEERARELAQRTQEYTQERLQAETEAAYRDVGGAAAGSDPSRLRTAAYASDQVGLQAAADAAALKAMEDQAFRQQLMGVYGRRGEYGLGAAGLGSDLYSMRWQDVAHQEAMEAQRRAQEAEDVARWTGVGVGAVSGLLGVL